MRFFKPRLFDYLGIDIGSSSIKVVEMRNENGRARLSTYGWSETKAEAPRIEVEAGIESKAALIRDILKKCNATATNVITALPTYAVFSAVLTFPSKLGRKELPTAIRWEAKKVIPLPIDDMILDWKILPQDKGDGTSDVGGAQVGRVDPKQSYQRVLLTGAPKKLVSRYVEIFKLANLRLLSLETESFALVRSLIGTDPSPAMIVNFGSVATTISMIEHSIPILSRSIDVGGRNITRQIAKSLGISDERASYFKQDIGMEGGVGGVPKIITETLDPVINEIKYTKSVWQSQYSKRITKLVLTGGSSNMPGFTEYLTREVDIKAFVGDPWARVIYPEDLKPVLNEVGPKIAVAVGLAIRNIE